jgi:uncharacterized protein YbjT (DUF2867 family)
MYAILGANGKAGRAAIEKLRAQGASVRAVVRESSNTADLEALGCQIAFADLHDPDATSKAIDGATAVQVICPVNPRAKDAAAEMKNIIDVIAGALTATRPERILAISDYGAQVTSGTGGHDDFPLHGNVSKHGAGLAHISSIGRAYAKLGTRDKARSRDWGTAKFPSPG